MKKRIIIIAVAIAVFTIVLISRGNVFGTSNSAPVDGEYYLYAVEEEGRGTVLYMLNPFNPSVSQAFLQVDLPAVTLRSAAISPSFEWIALVPATTSVADDSIRLIHVPTQEIRTIQVNLGLAITPSVNYLGDELDVAWSPDSRYLAFNSDDESGQRDTYLYDVTSGESSSITFDLALESRLSWSPNAHYLAILSENCADISCTISLDVYDIAARARISSALLGEGGSPAFGAAACDLAWSPDSRFISLATSCDSSNPARIKDLFLVDAADGQISPITTFTETAIQDPQAPIEYPYRFAAFDSLWLDADTLLLGTIYAKGEIDRFEAHTYAYSISRGKLTPVQNNRMARDWAKSDLSGLVAYRSTSDYYAEQESTIEIARPQGATLSSQYSASPGCGPTWSPDGLFIAYTTHGEPFESCSTPAAGLMLVDAALKTSFPITPSPSGRLVPIGWLFIGSNTAPTTDDLRAETQRCVTQRGILNSLLSKIDSGQWGAFINEVHAQTGKNVEQSCSTSLIRIATSLSLTVSD